MNIQQMIKDIRKSYKLQQVIPEWTQFLEYVEKLNPKVIVEIGTGTGASSLCLSHFTECIISVDCRGPKNKSIFGDMQKNCETHFVRHDTNTKKAKRRVIHFLKGRTIDLLFIDGEHTYRGAKRDFNKFSPLVSPDGIIALHDIVDSPYHRKLNCNVYKFWDEIRDNYKHCELTTTDWGGIGIIGASTLV